MSELLVNTIKKADGTGSLTVPNATGTVVTTAGATFTGDLTLSSNGIYLGGATAANYLDDYEEGTWTPTFTDGGSNTYTSTYGDQTASYTKTGRVVHFSVSISANAATASNGLSGVEEIRVSGLPFTSKSGSLQYTGHAELAADFPAGFTNSGFFIRGNVSYIAFRMLGDDQSYDNVTVTMFDNGAGRFLQVSGFYITDA